MNRDAFRFAYTAKMTADTRAEMELYGEIVPTPPKWYQDEYPDDKSAKMFSDEIKGLRDKGAKELLLRINSPGGSVTESVAMRGILSGAGFDKITIRIEGLCASAATNIATIPGAEVEIMEGSYYMIHNPWNMVVGNADDMEKAAEILRNIEQSSRSFYCQRTGQDEQQMKDWMDAETWFTADEAVTAGFCDKVLEAGTELAAAALVSADTMRAMQSAYSHIPDGLTQRDSNIAPVAGEMTVINHGEEDDHSMDTQENVAVETVTETPEMTMDGLLAAYPALVEEIRQQAVQQERERTAEIDELTLPGYEADAADAKANGMSAMDFHKLIVQRTREKGKAYLQQRAEETAPAQEIAGDAPADEVDEDAEIKAYAKQAAEYGKSLSGSTNGMF